MKPLKFAAAYLLAFSQSYGHHYARAYAASAARQSWSRLYPQERAAAIAILVCAASFAAAAALYFTL